jgi:hypothetical protein
MENINDRLLELYQRHWGSYESTRNSMLARPLLLKIKDESRYISSDYRVMIFGQETNRWNSKNAWLPKETMNVYECFFNDGKVNYPGPFWNESKRFMSLLQKAMPEKAISYTWNNVVKIGREGKGFPGEVAFNNELSCFNVINEEINILNPDLLLFFSGPKYDYRIEKKLGPFEKIRIADYDTNFLCKIKFKNLSILSFRTYHPNYLYRKGIDRYKLFENILAGIMRNGF